MRKLLWTIILASVHFLLGCGTPAYVGPIRHQPPSEIEAVTLGKSRCFILYETWQPAKRAVEFWNSPVAARTMIASQRDLGTGQTEEEARPLANLNGGHVGFVLDPPVVSANTEFKDTRISIVEVQCPAMSTSNSLTLAVQWRAIPGGPPIVTTRPSMKRIVTYPVWGLPRDLLDLPVTLSRRIGFDEQMWDRPNPAGLIGVPIFLAGIYFPLQAVLNLGLPLAIGAPAVVLAVGVGAYVGFTIAVWVVMAAPHIFRLLVEPTQVAILRNGINSEDYFPNWQFFALRKGDHREPTITDHEWVIESIEQID